MILSFPSLLPTCEHGGSNRHLLKQFQGSYKHNMACCVCVLLQWKYFCELYRIIHYRDRPGYWRKWIPRDWKRHEFRFYDLY